VKERIKSFIEVDQVLSEEAARGESNRCLSCCLTCYNPDSESGGAPVTAEEEKKLETAG
jgi:hypothetical protein